MTKYSEEQVALANQMMLEGAGTRAIAAALGLEYVQAASVIRRVRKENSGISKRSAPNEGRKTLRDLKVARQAAMEIKVYWARKGFDVDVQVDAFGRISSNLTGGRPK